MNLRYATSCVVLLAMLALAGCGKKDEQLPPVTGQTPVEIPVSPEEKAERAKKEQERVEREKKEKQPKETVDPKPDPKPDAKEQPKGPTKVGEKADPTTAPIAENGGPTDHTMFGGTLARNMVNLKDKVAKLPPSTPRASDFPEQKDYEEAHKKWLDVFEKDWLVWKADLGSRAYGGPIVAGGRVFVGT
ncbi:MAG: hypothetical protein K2V38_07310, partial [Gemmataceae bacterium]|nr:hypothetical protein [Gemmataceae bacterium]